MASKKVIKLIVSIFVLSALFLAPIGAEAAFPEKPVQVIVPFSPGGGNDVLIRLVGKYIDPYLGNTMVVENKPGAGGQIGWTAAANARADGYTLTATSFPSMILLKALRDAVPFEFSDFHFICSLQYDPIIWVVSENSAFKTVDDVIEFAKANPGKMNVAGDGPQSNVQFQHLLACKMLGIETNFISFNGSAAANTAVLGDKVDLGATTLSSALTHIESGKFKPIVLFFEDREKSIPDVPTAIEAFNMEIPSVGNSMRGVATQKDVPDDVKAKLEEAFKKAAENGEFLAQAENMGLNIKFVDSAHVTSLIETSINLVEGNKELFK
ncbi:MAG: tripartite tricarboxylate transporter substrate binding protein [Clostridiales bacterium]|nr:tripartite tricarboxylate transporter substrate binding protein [Clostridiales bacterium]